METVSKKLASLVDEKLVDTDCYLVEIKILPGNKVQVFLDSDTFVNVRYCAQVSRHLETFLDEEQPLGEKYLLEVSSAGMDNPLVLERQYVKNIGREITVLLVNGERKDGVLKSYENDKLVLEMLVGKKKEKELVKTEIEVSAIKNATRIIKF